MSATKKMWGERFASFFQVTRNDTFQNVMAFLAAVAFIIVLIGGLIWGMHKLFNDPEVNPKELINSTQCEAHAIDAYLASGNTLRQRQYSLIKRTCFGQNAVNEQRAAIKDKL